MIDYIRGMIWHIYQEPVLGGSSRHISIIINNIGYSVAISNRTFKNVLENYSDQKIELFVYHYVNFDSNVDMLIGFKNRESLKLFSCLMKVRRLGVNKLMKIFSITPSEIRDALDREDHSFFAQFKGVGQKLTHEIFKYWRSI